MVAAQCSENRVVSRSSHRPADLRNKVLSFYGEYDYADGSGPGCTLGGGRRGAGAPRSLACRGRLRFQTILSYSPLSMEEPEAPGHLLCESVSVDEARANGDFCARFVLALRNDPAEIWPTLVRPLVLPRRHCSAHSVRPLRPFSGAYYAQLPQPPLPVGPAGNRCYLVLCRSGGWGRLHL